MHNKKYAFFELKCRRGFKQRRENESGLENKLICKLLKDMKLN